MEDGEIVVLRPDGLTFLDLDGRALDKHRQRIPWDPIMAEKGGYKHFMLKEIHEQPRAVRDTLLGRVVARVVVDPARGDRACRTTSWRAIESDGDRRLRHVVARRPRGQVPDRAPGRAPGRGRLRLRVPLPAPARRRPDAGRVHQPVGRDGRYAGRAARGQERAVLDRSAICNVQGSMLTREARGTIYTHAGPEIGVASTKAFTSQLVALTLLALKLGQVARHAWPTTTLRAIVRDLYHIPAQMEQYLADESQIEELAHDVPAPPRLPVPRPRRELPDRPRGRAEAQGDLLHPRRGLPGGRDEARADRADRRGDAGRGHRARTTRVFEKMLSNIEEVKARSGIVHRGDRRRRRRPGARRPTHVIRVPRDARAARAAVDGAPAAAAGLPHRAAARLRRGPAAQPGQERHGRVARPASRIDCSTNSRLRWASGSSGPRATAARAA